MALQVEILAKLHATGRVGVPSPAEIARQRIVPLNHDCGGRGAAAAPTGGGESDSRMFEQPLDKRLVGHFGMKLPLLYKDNRLDGETPTRQAQLIELHLLEVLKAICEANRIPFWLDGGTLIGALRHGRFIPWDDDLDVCILKKDFKRFVRAAQEMLPDDVYLELSNQNLRMENHISRLRDNYSWGLVRRDKRLLVNDHHGVCIDIFTLRECSRRNWLSKAILRKLASHYGWYKRAHYNEVTLLNWGKKWMLGAWVLCLKVAFESTQFFGKTRYLVKDTWFVNEKLWWPIEWLVRSGESPRMTKFENTIMPIPYEAEKMLDQQFGGWHALPPEDKREGYLSVCLPTTPCFHAAAMTYNKNA